MTEPIRIDALTPEALARLDDDDVEGALVDYVSRRTDPGLGEAENFERLGPGLQVWYAAFVVDAEVLNGGFNQLFFNPSAAIAAYAPGAFAQLGIAPASEILLKAIGLLNSHAPALQEAANAGTIDAFMETYLDQPFAELDAVYAERQEEWRQARLRWIRSGKLV